MKTIKKKKNISNEEEDYIIDNDQDIIEYQNNNNRNNKSNLNRNNKSPKGVNKNKTGNWIREAKAKYQQERNENKNIFNKTDLTISNNNRKPKKILNFDDIPVGGGMGGGGDFNIEIKVPPKKNNYLQNNNLKENNIQFRNETNLRQNLENKTDFIKPKKNNNYLEENNNNNFEPVEMQRKNSMASMITQTCDREMLGRSEFIGIPINQNNTDIYSSKIDRLNSNNNKPNYSIYEKQDNFSKVSTNNFETSNITNKISEYNNTQNIREKTESAIQLQNVQRELDNEIEMNKRLQGQIENYKSEFNNLSNYEEMKKNFDKAIERIKVLSDENAELKDTIMMYEQNSKKIKKEKRYNKDRKGAEKIYKNRRYNDKKDLKSEKEEEENQNENEEENNYIENENNFENKNIQLETKKDNNKNNEEKVNIEDEIIEENRQGKNSIIPEDNDIFGTRNYDNPNKNIKKPRKIQEDGIPVIKRVEEKDNVKDIMVNNYAANDDIYYNRPPVGKPKVKRMKRNNDLDKNINNYQEQNTNSKLDTEYRKNNIDYNNENIDEEVKNNEKTEGLDEYGNIQKNINNQRKNNFDKIKNNVGVFPSQIKGIQNEREILELESQLFNLQKQRDLINDEYLKFPEYPKKREEINAKRKVEMKLEEMNKEISLQKLKIRELKNKK